MSATEYTTQQPSNGRAAETERKARTALRLYQVMAFITGVMLLILTAEMVLKYGFNDSEPVIGTWVAFVHGWIYVIYAVAVFNLWSLMRWSFGRIVVLVAAGVVPVLSFVLERRATAWFGQDLPAVLQRARSSAGR